MKHVTKVTSYLATELDQNTRLISLSHASSFQTPMGMNAKVMTMFIRCAWDNNYKNNPAATVQLFSFVGFFPRTFPLLQIPYFTSLWPNPFPYPSSTAGNHWSILQIFTFTILRMLYKQNHTTCNDLKLAFFTQHSPLKIHARLCVYK